MENNEIIPWNIRPTDCLGQDIAINDIVAFVCTNYRDEFDFMATGEIVGFTDCFVKIRPNYDLIDNFKIIYHFNRFVGDKWGRAEYVLRSKNRVIKI